MIGRMDISPIEQAVINAGGQSALARILSTETRALKQGHVWAWVNRGNPVPAEFVLAIETATGVSRHDLRPDVFGPAPEGEAA